jgi:hypothetical protein
MEETMDKIDHDEKGYVMNIKEKFYICVYKQYNRLINEQKTYRDNHKIILFDTAMTYVDTLTLIYIVLLQI